MLAFIDIDSTQKRVYGHKKEGARFGHTKIQGKSVLVRGLNALIAAVSTPLAAPVAAATRLRGGNAPSARGAAGLAAQAIGTARACGCTGTIVVRMDSAYYAAAVIAAIRRNGARFSVTAPVTAAIRTAIAAIPEDAWTAIEYPQAVWDDQLDCWVSDAEIAETRYTAFTSKKKELHVTARLIVRRVRDKAKAAPGQGELFPAWRYHAVFTDSPYELAQAEEQHRGHAVIEQLLADLNDGPLAHLPSGKFTANAAWLAIAAIAATWSGPPAPGLLPPRQSPRGHHPPRPGRRRAPHRPPRPERPHPAPARRLAPRARVAEPFRSRLRPARRSGLTSPEPVRNPYARQGTPPPAPDPGPRTSRRTVSGRQSTPSKLSSTRTAHTKSVGGLRLRLKDGPESAERHCQCLVEVGTSCPVPV